MLDLTQLYRISIYYETNDFNQYCDYFRSPNTQSRYVNREIIRIEKTQTPQNFSKILDLF